MFILTSFYLILKCRCTFLVLSTLVQTSRATGYLTGDSTPVLWQTFTTVDSCNASNTVKSTEMVLTNPNAQGIYLTLERPATIYSLKATPATVKLSLANTFNLAITQGYMLPHVNIHSCGAHLLQKWSLYSHYACCSLLHRGLYTIRGKHTW